MASIRPLRLPHDRALHEPAFFSLGQGGAGAARQPQGLSVDLAQTPDLAKALADPAYKATVERGLVIKVEAFDWNCPQHIAPRYSLADIAPSINALQARVAELEAEVRLLRGGDNG